MHSKINALHQNLEEILRMVVEAKAQSVNLVDFSGMGFEGYYLRTDKWPEACW
jgi:hypothetical protein